MIIKNSVKKRSDKALGSLQSIVEDLMSANEEASSVIEEQQVRINLLSDSNIDLKAQQKRNDIVINNLTKLLGQ